GRCARLPGRACPRPRPGPRIVQPRNSSMIRLHDLKYSVGARVLFEGLDWTIGPGDRCALVGPNGTGKTTLLRIALGELSPESGTRSVSRGARIGYLPQEAAERFDGTVLARALEARRDVLRMREQL